MTESADRVEIILNRAVNGITYTRTRVGRFALNFAVLLLFLVSMMSGICIWPFSSLSKVNLILGCLLCKY